MTLFQIKIIIRLKKNQFNITKTAESLNVVQSAISRQIKLIEEDLGLPLFMKKGKRYLDFTKEGYAIYDQALTIEQATNNILKFSQEALQEKVGRIRIATTHTQAKYFLPKHLTRFREMYPQVSIEIEQSAPADLIKKVIESEVDIAISTEQIDQDDSLITKFCYQWHHALILPKDHPLSKDDKNSITLEKISKYPILSYVHGFTGGGIIRKEFKKKNLDIKIGLAASDTDIIKTYVKLNFGIGIIAEMAYDHELDHQLSLISLEKCLPKFETKVAYLKNAFQPKYLQHFIELISEENHH
ncbi:MAG: LysR family transcriptional regulator, cys regulon transcriptional activator [Thiomicrorhabdus sp.]|nr:MAG: LysR family transcriptional regulator, cys regulon transcriptional activator [Thiomicrorhabdus sp.]